MKRGEKKEGGEGLQNNVLHVCGAADKEGSSLKGRGEGCVS